MIKKISIVLLLLGFFAAQVFAETEIDINHPTQTATTVVVFEMEESYSIVIPASIQIPYGAAETDIVINVSNLALGSGRMLQIAVDKFEGKLQHETDEPGIPYLLETEDGSEPLLDFLIPQKQNLNIIISEDAWANAIPGDYNDVITLKVIFDVVTAYVVSIL